MIARANYHTHTTYCDGKSTAEEMVKAAIENNMTALGFSAHAYMPIDNDFSLTKENTLKYKEEITRLKEKYKDKIRIYCGLEMDYFSEEVIGGFDYYIGSCHYVLKNGKYFGVDESEEAFIRNVKEGWAGDFYGFCEDYYSLVSDVLRKTGADIIGHFDLVTKFNEGDKLFQTEHPRYKEAVRSAIKKLVPEGVPFEINTGAIARGYRTEPYPSETILKEIKENNGKVIFSSDSHSDDTLGFGYDLVTQIAKRAGFNSFYDIFMGDIKI